MKINQKVRYGVACLYELSKNPHEYKHTDEIAAKQSIPTAYAHKVLQSMAHSGLIQSMKGFGYKLQKPLSEITALQVIDALSKEETPNNSVIGSLLDARINKALGSFTIHELTTSI